MVAKDGTITVSLTIGKKDQDIANWFNMLRAGGQSKSMWASAFLMAYEKGVVLDTGCVTTPGETPCNASAVHPNPSHADGNRRQAADTLLFGTGKINAKPYRHDSGWGNRGPNGEYIIGSTITLRITNREVIKTYWKLVGEGYHISTLIKYTLRSGLRQGISEELPDPEEARKLLTFPPFKVLKPAAKPPVQGASTGLSRHGAPSDVSPEKRSGRPSDSHAHGEKARNPLLNYI